MASLPQCLSARLRDAGAVFDQPVDRDTKTVPCCQSGSTEFADHTVVIASADDLFGALVTSAADAEHLHHHGSRGLRLWGSLSEETVPEFLCRKGGRSCARSRVGPSSRSDVVRFSGRSQAPPRLFRPPRLLRAQPPLWSQCPNSMARSCGPWQSGE